jgi:hypothetical protein
MPGFVISLMRSMQSTRLLAAGAVVTLLPLWIPSNRTTNSYG